MPTPDLSAFRRLALAGRPSADDGELLRRYAEGRDEGAFAELVDRTGRLVLRVCRNALTDPADADDAFQATYLRLAEHAARLTRMASVAGWLHTAAVREAGKVRRAAARRRVRESAAAATAVAPPGDEVTWREVREKVDAELARLPEAYRGPLLLCYVEGLTYAAAACDLGCSEGTLRGRLERGRAVLRRRLERLGLPAAALALTADAPPAVAATLREAAVGAARAARPVAVSFSGATGVWLAVGCAAAAACVGLAAADPRTGQPGEAGRSTRPVTVKTPHAVPRAAPNATARPPAPPVQPDLKTIAAAWKARQGLIRTASFDMEVTSTRTPRSFAPPRPVGPQGGDRPTHPPDKDFTTVYPVALTLAGDRHRYTYRRETWNPLDGRARTVEYAGAFDGAARTVLLTYPGQMVRADARRYTGAAATRGTDADALTVAAVVVSTIPTSVLTGDWRLDKYELTKKTVEVGGHRCVELTKESPGGVCRALYLDPACGWNVRRVTTLHQGLEALRYTVGYAADPVAGWVPSEWEWTMTTADGELLEGEKVVVRGYQLNREVGPDEFRVAFPPGVQVYEQRR
jgi:RNA polymerase sigma factor (sigma-70 family)